MIKIIGLIFEHESDCSSKHIVCGLKSDNSKVEITLSTKNGINVRTVVRFGGYTWIPKEQLNADIIVLGNKYKFDIEDIKTRCVGDNEFRLVNFSQV